jgi:hypothetical protein
MMNEYYFWHFLKPSSRSRISAARYWIGYWVLIFESMAYIVKMESVKYFEVLEKILSYIGLQVKDSNKLINK